MPPETHARVAKTAKALGLDINGLINLLIQQQLPYWEIHAMRDRESGRLPPNQATVRQLLDEISGFANLAKSLVNRLESGDPQGIAEYEDLNLPLSQPSSQPEANGEPSPLEGSE